MSGLTAIAGALGELEPTDPRGDVTPEHCDRLDILCLAAASVPVRSAQDVALALSAVAQGLERIRAFDLDEAEIGDVCEKATSALSNAMRWITETHGVKPIRSVWR